MTNPGEPSEKAREILAKVRAGKYIHICGADDSDWIFDLFSDEAVLLIDEAIAAARPPMPEDVAGLCDDLRLEKREVTWRAAAALEAQAAEIARLRSALEAINKEGE